MIRRLIILLLIVGCGTEPEDVVIPSPSVVCENNYSEVDGSLISCGSGCLGAEGGCYLQNDIDVLADIIELDSLDIPYLQLGSQSWIQGRLISLDVSNVSPNLDTLPNSISNLTALTTLDLSYNNLTTLPNTICDIYDSLATIQLKSNRICPPYPECITDDDLDYQIQNECESIGCMDNTACNYDESVMYSYLNDACWYASEGCDCSFPQYSVADCDGVCNGTSVLSGCDNVCNSTVEVDCAGDCGGTNFDANSDGFCDDWVDLTVTDVDGNIYETVQIGEQLWMAENLKVTHYNDGSEIPTGHSGSDWANLSTGAYAVYDNNSSNADIYGNLYNWFAVDDDRGVCPEGLHVPADAEYTALTDYLGGESVAGGKMKEAGYEHWGSPNTGATNESGFTALPASGRSGIHGGYLYTTNSFFWSSSEYDSNNAWFRILGHSYSSVGQIYTLNNSFSKPYGFSVRCLKD